MTDSPRFQPVRVLSALALAAGLALAARTGLGQEHLTRMPRPEELLPGRAAPLAPAPRHILYGNRLDQAPAGSERVYFGMGCFWGAEEHFFRVPGVVSTAVGYAGGGTPNPTYEEVCSGRTGHAEVVAVNYDPRRVTFEQLLRVFWENHDPTQGMRQGNDSGTQYRSVLYTTTDAQQRAALASRDAYNTALRARGFGAITTEVRRAPDFFLAEGYHQQYCALNPHGYCGHGGVGVSLPAFTAQR